MANQGHTSAVELEYTPEIMTTSFILFEPKGIIDGSRNYCPNLDL